MKKKNLFAGWNLASFVRVPLATGNFSPDSSAQFHGCGAICFHFCEASFLHRIEISLQLPGWV